MQQENSQNLITLTEASTMAGKSVSTIRNWIRKGKITGHKEDPGNKNSALFVDQGELRVFLGLNGKVTSPNVGRGEDLSVSLKAKDDKIQQLILEKQVLELAVKNGQQLAVKNDELVASLQNNIKDRENQITSLNNQVEQVLSLLASCQASVAKLTAENKQLMTYLTLPFWKRITTSLMLEDKNDNKK
jgi:hypothetical protein